MASSNDQHLSRRRFLQRLGAATSGVAALGSSKSLQCSDGSDTPLDVASHIDAVRSADASAIPSLTNPNILIIMVDQLRAPAWLNPTQLTLLDSQVLPTIFGQIRNRSVMFDNFYVAAASCSPSRAALLTGLYSYQTAMYSTRESLTLHPAFPTWGSALATLNPAYKDNVWWFGKWHLTRHSGTPNPLLPYGFKTRRFPSDRNRSPDGMPNEGTNGGPFPAPPATPNDYYANDSDIAQDFVGWLQGQTTAPWCATVSFINPHDIGAYPGFFPPEYPPEHPFSPVYFPPPAPPTANYLYSSLPSPWNYETPQQLAAKKIGLQKQHQQMMNNSCGEVSNWAHFLNWYYWLQHYVDTQVKVVLDALNETGFANNTIIIFTSDHGEYAGSHGLRGKAGGAYDESMRVPLYIRFPGMSSSTTRSHMCSSVDLFGLICDLGTSGAGLWTTRYPDLATREPIYKFIYNANLREQKRITPGLNAPYVLHTVDETGPGKSHLVCLRTKSEPGNPYTGAKYGVYSQWGQGATIPDLSVAPDQEFYDYTNKRNRSELGNDYLNPGPATSALITKFRQALGNYGPPATGIIGSELNRPLIGTGTDGQLLTIAQAAARQAYLDSIG